MARITQSPHHFSRGISSTLTLASSRWRQHWLLLLSGSFTTLRSLGATAVQVTGLFLLEQGVVFFTALLIGLLIGAILSATIVPTLIFSDIPITGILGNLSDSQFYLIQQTLPRHVVIPSSLGVALVLLVGICIIAIWAMTRTALRPSLSASLRLNDD